MATQIKTPRPKLIVSGVAEAPARKSTPVPPSSAKREPMKPDPKVDTLWFKSRMAQVNLTLRALAKRLDLEPSAVSLMLRGMRKTSVDEAGQIAHWLGESVDEVLRHLGVEVRTSASAIRIGGTVEGEDQAVLDPRLQAFVPRPPGLGEHAEALRVLGGLWDGWVAIFQRRQGGVGEASLASGIPADAVGRLCMVQVAGEEGLRLRWVHRGYEDGFWNLTALDGGKPEAQRLAQACPVLWMRQ